MDKYTEINELILKHLKQELTPEETVLLNNWVEQSDKNRRFFSRISNPQKVMADVRSLEETYRIDVDEAWTKMRATVLQSLEAEQPARVVKIKWWRYAAAIAAVLLIVPVGIYLLRQTDKPAVAPTIVKATAEVKPNSNKAYLTLDNGENIVLDSLQTGLVATQGNTKVEKQKNGVLSYSGGSASQKMIYNKVTVPRGSDVVYMKLSDGTKVWLNAASSIRYPVEFSEEERKVEITGEAYFEVTTLRLRSGQGTKFTVSKGNMNVVVLGTRFNVNAYDNEENIKVTLLEGSVKVLSLGDKGVTERTIKPGQQAVLKDAGINVENDVDIEQVMAWKEGKFVFNNTNIQLIMRQVERWYDLEKTQFESNDVKQWEFNGEVSRYNNASKVLQLLEKTGSVKFTMEGKKIVVKQ